jgi:large subunit ribosomal protein L31e
MMSETRTYTIPLRSKFRKKPKYKRAPRAVKAVKEFISKHGKAHTDNVRLSSKLNEHIWQNGARNPPHKVTVVAEPAEELIQVMLEEEHGATPTKQAVPEEVEEDAEEETEEPEDTETAEDEEDEEAE